MYKILATVTARGGSKRIPKKSIVPLNGKPSMLYVLEALKKSKTVNRIIVDTDDQEMAEVGRQGGAEIPFMRPAHLASDKAGHVDVLKYELEFLKEKEGYWPDAVVLIQPTSPLVKPEDIDACVELILKEDLDSVETVFEVGTIFHPYRVRHIDQNGFTKFFMPKERAESMKTGNWPKIYAVDAVFCFKPDTLYKYGTLQGEKSKSIIIPRSRACDIDDPADIILAEAQIKHFLETE